MANIKTDICDVKYNQQLLTARPLKEDYWEGREILTVDCGKNDQYKIVPTFYGIDGLEVSTDEYSSMKKNKLDIHFKYDSISDIFGSYQLPFSPTAKVEIWEISGKVEKLVQTTPLNITKFYFVGDSVNVSVDEIFSENEKYAKIKFTTNTASEVESFEIISIKFNKDVELRNDDNDYFKFPLTIQNGDKIEVKALEEGKHELYSFRYRINYVNEGDEDYKPSVEFTVYLDLDLGTYEID